MRVVVFCFLTLIIIQNNAYAHVDTDLTFSIEVTQAKDEIKALSNIQKAAKKEIKAKCPKKTKFQAEIVTVNVGRTEDGKYSANANYEGICKIK